MAQRGAFKKIEVAGNKKLEWVMVRDNSKKTLDYLKDEFFYHDIDLADVGPPLQSPKIAIRSDYVFVVLQIPIFNDNTREAHTAEIDFFIEKDRIITIDLYGVKDLQNLFKIFSQKKTFPKTSTKHIVDDVPHLTYLIINSLIESLYPDLRSLSTDIETIEDHLFDSYDRAFIGDLLRVKTNIVRFRQAMQGHDEILMRLAVFLKENVKMQKVLDVYFQQLIDDTRDIKNRLLLKRETIDALHETNQSLTDFRTNEIIKTLTIVSFVVFPLTLLAGIFGMNAINMPFVNHPLGFWIIIGIMLTGCVFMIGFFRHKKWI
ncbi:MAG: magnesium transporter CorA family protein [Patescibacteria group bacterium]|nr:magnesium transporter CorA family protein [Patescibacteria group bacterium]